MTYDVNLRVWRGDADGGELVDYDVAVEEGEVVLDAIHRLQATDANDLAVRWNCKAGKCGSCSAEINGKPSLMCMSRLNEFPVDEPITVTPMRTFPVIRDLVTDVSWNYDMARKLPSFSPRPREADGTHRMQQVDVDRLQEFRKCIECFLCQNTCHVVRDHDENKPEFAGPRFFLRYAELDMHPLDTHDRREVTQDNMGLGMCNITKCCSEVCPEGIKITDNAIIPMKERVVDAKYDPLVWLGNKIRRRKPDDEPVREPLTDTPARHGGTRWVDTAAASARPEVPDRGAIEPGLPKGIETPWPKLDPEVLRAAINGSANGGRPPGGPDPIEPAQADAAGTNDPAANY